MSLLQELLAMGGDLVNLTPDSIDAGEAFPTDAIASLRMNSNGFQQRSIANPSSFTNVAAYVIPQANAGLYECQVIQNSGTTVTGSALSTWLALTATRTWTLTQIGSGTLLADLTLQIRQVGTTQVLDSVAIAMSVDSS